MASVSQEFVTLFMNALGVVAALSWSDALNSFLKRIRFFSAYPLTGPFMFAATLSLMVYFAGRLLGGYTKPSCVKLCPAPAQTTKPVM